MSFENVREILVNRLKEGDRGDRGWFVITRVHVALSWLKAISGYLEKRSLGSSIELNAHDYNRLATIIETNNIDPGVQLRRHHLLVMDKPLHLLRRVNGRSWGEIALTDRGRELALSDDPAEVLEQSLADIRFAVDPWSPPDRVDQYSEFDVQVYEVTGRVLQRSGGYLDRNEFDFFVSRIRRLSEVDWAVNAIAQYRALSRMEQGALHNEVRSRTPGAKAYSNWRDVGLHTFSLFSLGTSMVRDGTRLLLTSHWTATQGVNKGEEGAGEPELKMPEPTESEALLTPPSAPASNDGADAESFVAKVFRSQGWTVAFYTNRRGFGFDLWARKDDKAIVIEVKSSVGNLGSVNLTDTEYLAAMEHGANYVLALVEHINSDKPRLLLIQNPAEILEIVESTSTAYTISRAEWLRVTELTT